MSCKLCGAHANIKVCLRCHDCDHAHQMKFGLNWRDREEKKNTNEPCPQICKFRLPNNQWITYKCTKKNYHDGECDFNINVKTVNRLARDASGGR